MIGNYRLQWVKAGAIMDSEKGDTGFGITTGSDPALHGQAGANGEFALEHINYGCVHHLIYFSNFKIFRVKAPAFMIA